MTETIDETELVLAGGWTFDGDEWSRIAHPDDCDGSFTYVRDGRVFADTAWSACEYDGLTNNSN